MLRIVPLVASLQEHLDKLASTPELYRPKKCPHCGVAGLWNHGHYGRKADRETGELNLVPIPRFFCRGCRRTCSCVPSCIPPRRWYLWSVQQAILVHLLSGNTLEECATKHEHLGPAMSTMQRWFRWLKARHDQFAFHLLTRQPEWGRAKEWREFWQRAIAQEPLCDLMAYLDSQGLIVP